MLFFLAYLAVRRLVRVFGAGSEVAALEVENALLRHQLAVLRRTVEDVPRVVEFRDGGPRVIVTSLRR